MKWFKLANLIMGAVVASCITFYAFTIVNEALDTYRLMSRIGGYGKPTDPLPTADPSRAGPSWEPGSIVLDAETFRPIVWGRSVE